MEHILVTGSNGQLGQAIRRLSTAHPSFQFYFTDIDVLDITDKQAVDTFMQVHRISYVLNCAAYTDVNRAETDETLAERVNAEAVCILGEVSAAQSAKMIHVSTDYVFDGTNCLPYTETDATCPVSAYGRTKLKGEQLLQAVCPDAVIIRTAWLYSEWGNNFVKTMLRLGKEREELCVVFDQVGTPTYAGDLAEAMLTIVEAASHGHFVPGVYHYSDEGVCSWYDFTVKILALGGLPCRVEAIETKDYPTPAIRPAYSVLNKAKIKEIYKMAVPHWEESLKKMINGLMSND